MRQGSLYADQAPDTGWRPPENLPNIRGKFKRGSCDSETDGLDWRGQSRAIGYSFKFEDGSKYYLPFGHKAGGNLDKNVVVRWMNENLRDMDLYFAEGKLDIQMARKDGVDFEKNNIKPREVQYRAALLDDTRTSFKLEDMAQDYLGRKKFDINRKDIWELSSHEVGPYAEQDADLTYDLGVHLDNLIDKKNLRRVSNLEDDLLYCVCEMERNGVPIDVPKMQAWHKDILHRVQDIVVDLNHKYGIRVNPNSSPDIAKLFNLKGWDYPLTSPKLDKKTGLMKPGSPSFTDQFLKTVDYDEVKQIRRARSLLSLDSKYVGKYLREQVDGYLYYKLHQLKSGEDDDFEGFGGWGTISGRFSSSSVNIQQVYKPSRQMKKLGTLEFVIRELFTPRPGRLWVKCDAQAIEYRLFAHYAKAKKILEAYAKDPDVDYHAIVQEMIRPYRVLDRDDTKNLNFAKLYGAGVDKVMAMLRLSRAEATKLIAQYDEVFPEARELMKTAMKLAHDRGYVKTALGRMALFDKQLADEEYNDWAKRVRVWSALNRVIQGTAADVMKLKLLETYNNRKQLDLHMFFTVHDEIDGDIGSEAKVLEFKKMLDEPIGELKLRVPIRWETKCVKNNWAEAA